MNRSTFVEPSREATAGRFGALADPARLAILDRLSRGTECACELGPSLGMAPNLLSYHLRILREAGLVTGTRSGRRIEYRLLVSGLAALRVELDRLAGSARREP
jgi:ArsR family transcriptional regulator